MTDHEAVLREDQGLHWHCRYCGDTENVEPPYTLGDKEPCTTCGMGVCEVMTLKQGAKFESEIAQGIRQPESAYD